MKQKRKIQLARQRLLTSKIKVGVVNSARLCSGTFHPYYNCGHPNLIAQCYYAGTATASCIYLLSLAALGTINLSFHPLTLTVRIK